MANEDRAMSREYRVTWKRVDLTPKSKRYVRKSSADRLVTLLTDPEPWVALKQNPSAFVCCSGVDCGCEGETVRERHESIRAAAPPLEWVRVETREVGRWAPSPEPEVTRGE